jgi:hypothetical protein
LDGKVVCLGPRGADLPAAQGVSLVPLDTQVKEPPPEAAPPATESLSKEFSRLVQAEVTKCELGYRVAAQGKKTAFALKKLAEPASGKFRLSAKMKITEAGELKNGFLVFGDRADDASLVKCGLRMALKKAVITQGASSGSKTAEQPLEIEADKTYEVRVTVDLASGEVAMQVGETTVKAKLDPVPQRVSFVGYGTISAVTEFSAYEIQAE